MKTLLETPILLLHTVLGAAIFGFFYAYSCSVMTGLDYADPLSAIKAMQAINATIKNQWFAPAFFGTILSGILATIIVYKHSNRKVSMLLLMATFIYVLGAFLPTLMVSVPMNNALATIDANAITTEAANIWNQYSGDWKFWNLVRTVASGLGVFFTALALLAYTPKTAD